MVKQETTVSVAGPGRTWSKVVRESIGSPEIRARTRSMAMQPTQPQINRL
jgi:hypothetical protein